MCQSNLWRILDIPAIQIWWSWCRSYVTRDVNSWQLLYLSKFTASIWHIKQICKILPPQYSKKIKSNVPIKIGQKYFSTYFKASIDLQLQWQLKEILYTRPKNILLDSNHKLIFWPIFFFESRWYPKNKPDNLISIANYQFVYLKEFFSCCNKKKSD